ncbi:MAG: type II toxin-antitoxin system VapC family toxin [Synechococcales bacterium]|nr:type II toxin-antitoxin system VapC family toxin [Synechococcales bacterium]
MYILDTDHLSLIQRGGIEGQRILTRLAPLQEDEIFVTVISYEEQIKGWFKALSTVKRPEDTAFGYLGLQQTARDFGVMNILSFDLPAIEQYETLRSIYRRLGKNDLKIAAIAIVQDAVLLTRNHKDFRQITELKSEDWSVC